MGGCLAKPHLGRKVAPGAATEEPGLLASLQQRWFCQESLWDFGERWQPEGPHGWTQERPEPGKQKKMQGCRS